MDAPIARFLAHHDPLVDSCPDVSIAPLHGGLESTVYRVTVQPAGAKRPPAQLIVKQLRGRPRREVSVYRELWAQPVPPPTVRWLGAEQADDAEYLFLEFFEATAPWPWADTSVAAAVCRALARLHDRPCISRELLGDWDYETELRHSAATTLDFATMARDPQGLPLWRRLGDLRRVVAALPEIRACLAKAGRTVIHGDVHPGNVLVGDGTAGGEPRIALVDWARARIGSPWEDLASWLHSLGCWEPEARRRHDSLLRAYLEASREAHVPTAELRTQYWYASASNGLSGAIRYHLSVLSDPLSSPQLCANSWCALRAWERVIKRVAALRATTPAG